jgi:hypothetical protein
MTHYLNLSGVDRIFLEKTLNYDKIDAQSIYIE